MQVWRCVQRDTVANAFIPTGQVRGRWNETHAQVIYAADTAALAVLEVAVNVGDLQRVRKHNVLVEATIPDSAVETLNESGLPLDWRNYPHASSTRALGDAWLRSGRSLGLAVPSAIVPGHNILLNAAHAMFSRLTVDTNAYRIAPFHPV